VRSLLDTVRRVRELIGGYRRWRWWALLALAILVSALEALGASLVYALVGLVSSPEIGQVPLPLIGDLSELFPDLEADTIRIAFAVGVAVFFIGRSAVVLARAYVQERLINNAGVMLASDLLRGYLAMPYVLHTRRSSAELVRNTYEATQHVVNRVVRPLVTIVSESIIAVGLLAILVLTAPTATLLAGFVFIPTLWILQGWIQPRLKLYGRDAQEARTGSISAVQQSLGAIRDIKLLDRASDFATTHAEQRFALARSQYRARTLQEAPRVLIESTLVVTIVIVFILAMVAGTAIDEVLATLGLFAYAGLRLQPALQKVVHSLNELRYSVPIVDDLIVDHREMAAWREEEHARQAERDTATSRFHDALRCEDVSFAYDSPDRAVIDRVSTTIRAGEFVGVCGPTGGGKSTLVDLLIGLLEPTSGVVTVDGRPLGARPAWWWAQLGVVSQQVFLVDDTLRANIAFGERADEVEADLLADCVRRAQLEPVISDLPHGLDTVVGERGIRLSGGQRQRVAIARALYRQPNVLVFDEGTSALDGATEAALVAALGEMKEGRTLIAVAHRLSTLRDADRILVVADGEVVDDGTYAELLDRSALFRSLAQ